VSGKYIEQIYGEKVFILLGKKSEIWRGILIFNKMNLKTFPFSEFY